MFFSDLSNILQWWVTIFIIGIIFIPITGLIFSNFLDKGYAFAKIIGIAFISYAVYALGFLRILPFEIQSIFLIIGIFLLINIFIKKKVSLSYKKIKPFLPMFIIEECIFLAILTFWAFIHAHQPDIHGLEKYMDYGFINSILRTKYFPPLDMWFTPFSINYYYFGHLTTAVLTKLAFIPSKITFNLMLSTIAALGFTAVFSIVFNLLKNSKLKISNLKTIIGGLLAAFLVNFAGNLHIIYAFFKPYENENPVPFWQLVFSPSANSYWYPNATRFIYHTIHEFPIYSNVVSDLHGHFLNIPFVLLTIAVLLALFLKGRLKTSKRQAILTTLLISFLLATMYMTNVWDGIIYFMLTICILFYIKLRSSMPLNHKGGIHCYLSRIKNPSFLTNIVLHAFFILTGFFIFSLPFNLSFKPFASGIGILCAPQFLTDIGNLGPFIFESKHCQHSPWWQLIILYGFFYFWVISFGMFIFSKIKSKYSEIASGDIFVIILIIFSTLLIILPEFIYIKDIYPTYYRANTMFKLVYQAFIMLSLSSAYIISRLFFHRKASSPKNFLWGFIYWMTGGLLLILVFIYPYFAIKSYFGDLNKYSGLDGIKYLEILYPQDFDAISWINKNIKGQPVILEAQGDSYTDYGRISVNTGLPTILGWTVHEWLWRGTYDIPAPRISEVQKIYESSNIENTKNLLEKYNVKFIFIGDLERLKYSTLNEKKLEELGKIVYQKKNTKIIELN